MKLTDTDFRKLVERHESMVFSIAFRVTGNRGAAEEVAQDTFLNLFSALPKLQSDDHILFWLRRVTVHRAEDYIRRRSRRPEYQAEEWQEGTDEAGRASLKEADPVGTRLDQILGSLPEAFREVIVLRYQEDMEPHEIAELLGQPLSAVKSNLQRGLELMRRKAQVMLREFIRE